MELGSGILALARSGILAPALASWLWLWPLALAFWRATLGDAPAPKRHVGARVEACLWFLVGVSQPGPGLLSLLGPATLRSSLACVTLGGSPGGLVVRPCTGLSVLAETILGELLLCLDPGDDVVSLAMMDDAGRASVATTNLMRRRMAAAYAPGPTLDLPALVEASGLLRIYIEYARRTTRRADEIIVIDRFLIVRRSS